jgi:predicted PurR-regulated permease PerM
MAAAVITAIVVGALYQVRVVFVPLALAIFLTFLLTPLVRALQHLGLGRIPSVLLVVTFATLVIGGVVWLVSSQMHSLLAELPNYESNIKEKARALRETFAGDSNARFAKLIEEVLGELGVATTPEQPAPDQANGAPAAVAPQPRETPGWMTNLLSYLGSAAQMLGGLALAVVLTIFMMFSREDLRNRFLRLVGKGRMPFTTKAVDDAAQRLSRFLLMQAVVNGTYGLAVTIGLYLLGVDYALLWGFLAGVLRYVPYVGPWVAALFPITLSLITSAGWWQPLLVIGMFLAFELLSNNVMEPMLYGQSMGVSEVALLIAAAFWAWLWGPIGLILSAPMTVCLIVLGKYVPQLKFLDVLLGDEPPLEPEVTYYQRLLARDQDEATGIILEAMKTSKGEEIYDRLLIPVLNYVRRDRERDDLTLTDEQFVLRATREILEDIGEQKEAARDGDTAARDDGHSGASPPVEFVAAPARDAVDLVALEMLGQALDPRRWQINLTAVENLNAEVVQLIADKESRLICIGSIPPGGLAHTRYLCKRLRNRFPAIKVLVCRWGLKGNVDDQRDQLQEAGADAMTTSLEETRTQLDAWHAVLAQESDTSDASNVKNSKSKTNTTSSN